MSVDEVLKNFKCDKTVLSMIYHINLQREQNEDSVLTILNKSISSSKYRLKGLELLNANIKSLPTGVILRNAVLWLNVCVGQHHKSLTEIKLVLIGKIIERVYEDQDFTKKLLSDYMTKILEICLSNQLNTYEIEASLLTLSICMKRYGSWFGAHKPKIELFLLNFLSQSKYLIEKAAEAFLQLQQVGGAGVDGANHRSNFSSSFHKLCVTIQKLFDKLFENETEIEQYDFSNEDGYQLAEPLNDVLKIGACIENCLTFVKTMMIKKFPEIKDIKPIEVLNIILRGTALHLCLSDSEENSLQDFQLATSLTGIQMKLLQLLNVFIIWSQGNALPFSYTVSKIFIDCLSRSQKCKCFKIHSQYKETVYTVLNCWLTVSRCAFHTNFQTKLVDHILGDITPTKNEIKLIVNNDKSAVTKNKKIHIRESIVNVQNNSSSLLSDSNIVQQQKICGTALTTLKYLLRSSWLRIGTEKLQSLYSVLIGSSFEVITQKHIHPYSNSFCQEKLFEVLVTFYEECNLSILPNINIALDILSKGSTNKNLKISAACERGLSFLEILCQPICPSLYSSENSLGKRIDEVEKIINITISEDKLQNEIVSDDHSNISLSEDLNDPTNLKEPGLFNNGDIVESVEEVIIENDLQVIDVVEKHSVHILDVQILNPPLDKEISESKIPEVQTDNLNNSEEVVNNSENDKLKLLESMSTENVSTEGLSESTISAVEVEEFDEPPPKIIKIEEQLEEIGDEFVDQVKEY